MLDHEAELAILEPLVGERVAVLAAAGEVENAQAAVAEADWPLPVKTFAIGAARWRSAAVMRASNAASMGLAESKERMPAMPHMEVG